MNVFASLTFSAVQEDTDVGSFGINIMSVLDVLRSSVKSKLRELLKQMEQTSIKPTLTFGRKAADYFQL